MTPEWKGEVPTLDLLNRMVTDPLPLGLRSGPVEPFFQRDIYFDSADWTLRRRGVSCRFRIRVDDRRILTLRTVGRWEGGVPLVLPQTFEADVAELEGEQALAGGSDPARRLRALIEPGRLIPRIQFETERRTRRTRPGWWRRARYELVYDVVTVRSHQLARTFQELTIRQLAAGRPTLEQVSGALRERYGLRPLLVGKADRAQKLLRDLEGEALARAAQGSREVAVVVLEEGRVALLADESQLTLPVRGGSGEDACREVLRVHFGSADGQVRFLGTAASSGTRPVLEVWLARRVSGARDADASGRLQWLPFHELLAGAGAPGLRDPRTLASLTVTARSNALAEWTREAPLEPGGSTAPRTGERRVRLSDVALRSPFAAAGPPVADHFLNSDLSLIEFHSRVLALAEDPDVPLLARVRFLAILSANLDEFFMVRVAALKRAVGSGVTQPGEDGLSPEEQLDAIAVRVRAVRAPGSLSARRVPAGARRARRSPAALERAGGAAAGGAAPLLHRAGLSAHHAAGPHPRARSPVPPHPQPEALARRGGARPRRRAAALRLSEGARRPASLRAARGRRRLRPDGGRHSREPQPALSGPTRRGRPRIPRDAGVGPGARRAPRRQPLAGDRGRGEAPALRGRGARRGGAGDA